MIEDAEAILKKVMRLRNSEFTEKALFADIEREKTREIETAILIKIASNENVFYADEKFSLLLITLLAERSNAMSMEELQKLNEILFWVSCESHFKSVRKLAAELLKPLVSEQEIAELAKKYLA